MNELSHVVVAILLPPTGALPLLLMGWWLRARRAWLARLFFALGLLGLWVGSSDLGALWLQERLLGPQQAFALARLKDVPPQQTAVVVLGGGGRLTVPEYGSPQLKTISIERLRYGIWLASRCDCRLLFTGSVGRGAKPGMLSEADLADRLARDEFGFIPTWLEKRSTDTRENALYSAELLQGTGIKRVLLVTHDVHMHRAMRAFRAALPPEVELIPAPMGLAGPGWDWRDLLPSHDGIARARYVGYEWLGTLAGH